MCEQILEQLQAANVDTKGALERFIGNAELYIQFLDKFQSDETIELVHAAAEANNWDDLFFAAHTMKGMAGNLGLTRLYEASAETVRLLRAKEYSAAADSVAELDAAHRETCDLISRAKQD